MDIDCVKNLLLAIDSLFDEKLKQNDSFPLITADQLCNKLSNKEYTFAEQKAVFYILSSNERIVNTIFKERRNKNVFRRYWYRSCYHCCHSSIYPDRHVHRDQPHG